LVHFIGLLIQGRDVCIGAALHDLKGGFLNGWMAARHQARSVQPR
jgi:hypothetical protein